MNPYKFPVTCDRCGGDGVGTIRTAGAAWDANSYITHRDRRICDEILAETKRLEEDWQYWLKQVVARERNLARRHLRRIVAKTRKELGLA